MKNETDLLGNRSKGSIELCEPLRCGLVFRPRPGSVISVGTEVRHFGRSGICKADSGRPHIPEIASIEVALRRIVVENGSEGGVSVALGLSRAETNIRRR